jgi:hypothetical protein
MGSRARGAGDGRHGDAGEALWREMLADVPTDWEFDRRDLELLAQAARLADTIVALEAAVARDGVTVVGAAGQRRLNGAVVELRQARLAIGRLLGQIDVPAEEGRPVTEASRRARHAADRRWAAHRAKRELRHGAA